MKRLDMIVTPSLTRSKSSNGDFNRMNQSCAARCRKNSTLTHSGEMKKCTERQVGAGLVRGTA